MAMKRKMRTRSKRSMYKKRRSNMLGRRPSRFIALNKVAFKRTFVWFNWSPNTAATTGFWQYLSLNLSNLQNSTDVTNLFDQYKINRIKLTFRPRYDSFAGNDTTDTVAPGITNLGGTYVHVVVDPYSTVSPSGTYTTATLNSFLEQGGVKSFQGNRPFSIYYKPSVDSNLGSTNTARRVSSKYLSTTQTGIPHYGIHVFTQDVNMTGTFGQSWDVFATMYITAKGLK